MSDRDDRSLAELEALFENELRATRQKSAELLHELEVQRLELEMQNEQLRLNEDLLSEARDRYFELFDMAPVAYLSMDRGGSIRKANFAAAALLGVDRNKLLGRPIDTLVSDEDFAAFQRFLKKVWQTGSRQTCEIGCRLADGTTIPVRMRGAATLDEQGDSGRARITIDDLSEITRAQRALAKQEAELRRSEDRLASFMRATNDCVLVLTSSGVIKNVNTATLALLGYAEDELVGKKISALDHGVKPPMSNERRSIEVVWPDAAGDKHTVLLTISPISEVEGDEVDEFLCVAQDITARKEATERLRVSERQLRQMAETIEDGFYIREHPSGVLSYASSAYERIFGTSLATLQAHSGPPLDLVHPDDLEQLVGAYEAFVKGDPCDEEFRIILPGGEVRWIRERAFLVEEEYGAVERIVGVVQDVTEQRQFELELRQGQKMEAIGQLAAGVAHDFNNILMGVHGCASIALSKTEADSDVRPFLEAIRKSSEGGTAIIKQLLAFSSKRDLGVKQFDLNGQIVANETMLARLLGDDVILRIAPAKAPCWVRMDPGQAEQILMNLAINARDAMPEGGELCVETDLVGDGESHEAPSFVELRVRDTGTGMTEEVRERIFEPFFTTKGIGEGTGLGLSTVYGLVREAGGGIRCVSEPGRGSTFVVRLPLYSEEGQAEMVEDSSEQARLASEDGVLVVLLAEDEDTVRFATRLYLEAAGFVVIEASSGPEALEILEAASEIDILLTDVGMPGLSGAALAEQVRNTMADLPILFMSAHRHEWLIQQGRLSAGEQVLQKPFSQAELLSQLQGMLPNPASGPS